MSQWVSTADLVTFLERLGLDLSKWDVGGGSYPDIDAIILLAQREFEARTERSYEYGSVTEALDGSGTNCILLRNFPVAEITGIRIIGTPQYNITSFVQEQVNPDLAKGLIYLSKQIGGVYPYTIWPVGYQNIEVDYSYGYSDSPPPGLAWPLDLLDAVKKMAASQVIMQTPSEVEASGLKKFKILNYQQEFNKDGIFARQLEEWKKQIDSTVQRYRSIYMSRPGYY